MTVGNPIDPATDIGPLVSRKQLESLKVQVADACEKGAKIEIGGKQPKDQALAKGNYFEPTVLTNIKHDMKVFYRRGFWTRVTDYTF